MDPLIPGDEELRRRLEAYADTRLRPDPLATARMRARVVAQARAANASAAPDGASVPHRAFHRWRPVAGLLAATVALGVLVGGVAASAPGGPLYGVRLWIEQVTLPSGANERAAAELERIEARFADVQAAAANGDRGALMAALAAYREAVDETEGSQLDGATQAHLEAMLSKHLDVLSALLATAPPQALEGLRNAIDNSSKAIERLESGHPAASPSHGPAASPPGGGKPSPEPGASAKPNASEKPAPSQGPAASPPGGGKPSPSPAASAEPDASEQPAASQGPAASPPGGGKPSPSP